MTPRITSVYCKQFFLSGKNSEGCETFLAVAWSLQSAADMADKKRTSDPTISITIEPLENQLEPK